MFPLWRLDEHAEHKSQFSQGGDRHGRETATQMLQLNNASSIYLSGRVAFKPMRTIFMINSAARAHSGPLCGAGGTALHAEERAEALHDSSRAQGHDRLSIGDQFVASRQATKRVCCAPSTQSRRRLGVLTNPLTRQFAADRSTNRRRKGAVARALGSLPRFALIGLREDKDHFLEALEARLQLPNGAIPGSTASQKFRNLLGSCASCPRRSCCSSRS